MLVICVPRDVSRRGEEGIRTISSSRFERTRRGLQKVYYGLCIAFGAVHAGLVVGALGAVAPVIAYAGAGLIVLGCLVGLMLTIRGQVMCLAVPGRACADGFLKANLVLRVIWILCLPVLGWLIYRLLGVKNPGDEVLRAAFVVAVICEGLGLGCFWTFLSFLRRLCAYLERYDLVFTGNSVVVRGMMLSGCHFVVVLLVATLFLRNSSSVSGFACAGVFVVLIIVANVLVFIQYANLLRDVDAAIAHPQ